jgi:hypothetical protein
LCMSVNEREGMREGGEGKGKERGGEVRGKGGGGDLGELGWVVSFRVGKWFFLLFDQPRAFTIKHYR